MKVRERAAGRITWPEGKDFAFTVFDDTDRSTLENVRPVYSLLAECGLRTTKSVWPTSELPAVPGVGTTCGDEDYVQWLRELQGQGFEIAYHMASFRSSLRQETLAGLNRFQELFGHYPHSMSNHVGCAENLYWGGARVTGLRRYIYNLLTRYRRDGRYVGHVEGSDYFWGDVCRDRIKYVRNFAFRDINTLRSCPFMPYHDPERSQVNYWFASTDAPKISKFCETLRESEQDRLQREGGACILYTHFAFGFCQNGSLDRRFEELVRRLGKKNGWFVPVSTLLDYLLEQRAAHVARKPDEITRHERAWLERKWLAEKLRNGTS